MNQEEFDKLVKSRLTKIEELLSKKGKEYGKDKDPLHNFNVGSNLENRSPEEILHGFMLKHYISYLDILEDIKNNEFTCSEEYIREKMGDIITYFVIQEIQLLNRIRL